MFCKKCGKEIADDAKFCHYCGEKVIVDTDNDEIIENEITVNDTEVVPFVNEVEVIKRDDDFDDEQTELIFDKKLPTDKLKTGDKTKTIAIVAGIIILIAIGIVSNIIISRNHSKKLKELQKTGIETTENGKIVYNKGNNVYAKNEIVKDGSDLYYFNSNEEMVKKDWVECEGKWYYCESDGKIAKSKWLEDTYYVDADGAMLKNAITPDGFFVGADGKYVEQTTKATTAYRAPAYTGSGGSGGGNYIAPSSGYTTPTQPSLNYDASKEFYITSYETYESYYDYDDETNVDISIKYPIFGGQDAGHVSSINAAMLANLSQLENYIDGDISSEDEARKPRRVRINEAKISAIEENKVYIIFSGNMERKGAGSKSLKYRFVYEKDTQSGYVKD